MDVRRIPASYRISKVNKSEHNSQMDVRRIPVSYRISKVKEHNSQMDVRCMSEGYQPATESVR